MWYACLCARMYVHGQDGLDASPSQCLLLKAERIPAGLHHKLTGAVWVSLPIKPLCPALTPSLLTHIIAASLEMLRKEDGDLLHKIASAPASVLPISAPQLESMHG